jgi:hypothetical protein
MSPGRSTLIGRMQSIDGGRTNIAEESCFKQPKTPSPTMIQKRINSHHAIAYVLNLKFDIE